MRWAPANGGMLTVGVCLEGGDSSYKVGWVVCRNKKAVVENEHSSDRSSPVSEV